MNLNVSPLQAFEVLGPRDLSFEQLQSLTLLYQPMLGAQAVSLYITLISMASYKQDKKSPKRHKDLLQHLNYGIQDLNLNRQKIEALSLVRSFRDPLSHPDNHHQTILYKIASPLDANAFFGNPLLRTALYSQVGEEDYKNLVEFFLLEDNISNYTEETASFKEVYQQLVRIESKSDPRPDNSQVKTYSTDFDYGKFRQFLMAEGINHQQFTQELREQVYAIYDIYQLNESQMANLVYMATDKRSSETDFLALKKLADRKYKEEASVDKAVSQPDTKNDNKDQENTLVSKEERSKELTEAYPQLSKEDIILTIMCEQLSNDNFLFNIKKAKNGFATDNEQFYVRDLVNRFNLKSEVINFLIYYLLIILAKKSVFKGDLQRYANEWQQAGITNVPEAIILITQLEKQEKSKKVPYKNKSRRSSNHKEIIPSWMRNQEEKPVEEEIRTMEDNEQDIRAKLNHLIEEEGEH